MCSNSIKKMLLHDMTGSSSTEATLVSGTTTVTDASSKKGQRKKAVVVGKTPVGETPVIETPVGETPVGETPVGDLEDAPEGESGDNFEDQMTNMFSPDFFAKAMKQLAEGFGPPGGFDEAREDDNDDDEDDDDEEEDVQDILREISASLVSSDGISISESIAGISTSLQGIEASLDKLAKIIWKMSNSKM